MHRLDQKSVLITGGGSGIGRTTALLFAREGAQVMIAGRRKGPLQETIQLIRQNGCQAGYLQGDVSQEADVMNMVKRVVDSCGRLDILVHSAGITRRNERLVEMAEETWDQQIDINLKGFMWVAKHSIQQMLKQDRGSIVVISSLLASIGIKGLPTYSAAKGGVNSLARNLAATYAGNHIRVNIISPGDVLTPMAYVGREDLDEYLDSYAEKYPLGRIGRPEDVAYAALFLAADEESGWMTGQNLILDGGFTLS